MMHKDPSDEYLLSVRILHFLKEKFFAGEGDLLTGLNSYSEKLDPVSTSAREEIRTWFCQRYCNITTKKIKIVFEQVSNNCSLS